jgi:hypothetical protein
MDIALQHLDEFPDYYTRLKKMEASARKEHKKFKDVRIDEEGLGDWFGKSKSKDKKPGWVDVVDGDACAREEGETATPKCVSSEKRASMSKEERLAAQAAKRREDPNQPQKSGASRPTMVTTDRKTRKEEMDLQEVKDKPGKGSGKKDACYTKVKSRYDVWPSAYASGALVKCRKVGAANWGTKSEAVNPAQQAAIAISMKKKGIKPKSEVNEETGMVRYCPKCQKDETRSECKYGEKYWDMFSLPMSLGKKYTPNTPHPGNFPESYDHEYSMARSEISTIIGAAKRLKKKIDRGEGNIEAWVQSKITKAADYIDAAADYVDSGEMKKESVSIEDANGNHYVQFIDIIKPQPLKASKGIGSNILGEGPSFEVGDKKLSSAQEKLHMMSPSQRSQLPSQMVKKLVGADLPPIKSSPGSMAKLADSYKSEKKSFTRFMFEASAAWQRKEGKNPEGGLNAAGVASYRRENPGSKLQTAVTTKPSKLKPGSKDAKRRKSFCARMSGMPGPTKDEKGRPTRKTLSLRKWNCN